MEKPLLPFFLVITPFTLIRLYVAPSFGLGVDEAHYFLYGKYLDFSYVDHPPLVGWIHGLFNYFFGTSEFLVRLPAILLFVLTSYLAYRFTMAVSGSRQSALLAVLALNSSFLLNALSLMLLPDCFLLSLIFFLIFLIKKIEDVPKAKYFFLLGIIFGLLGLAKYTSILLVPPLIVYFLWKRRYDLLFSAKMFGAGLIALLCVLPVFYWNFKNHFLSFSYQGRHLFGSSSVHLQPLLVSLGAQFAAYSPFLFCLAFYGFFKSLRSKNDFLRLALLMGGTLGAFFSYATLYETALPHWMSPFYILFIPIGVFFLGMDANRGKRIFLKTSIAFSLIVTLFLYGELKIKWIPFPDYQSPFRDIYGFHLIAEEANRILKENTNPFKALAVTEWTMGSRMMYYSLPYQNEVFVMDQRIDQFDLWQKNSPVGYDLLFVYSRFGGSDAINQFRCQKVQDVEGLNITRNGSKVDRIEFAWCWNYQGSKDAID